MTYEARATIGSSQYEMKVADDGRLISKMMKRGEKLSMKNEDQKRLPPTTRLVVLHLWLDARGFAVQVRYDIVRRLVVPG